VIELREGRTMLRIDVERGARLSSLEVHGRQLLVGPPDAEDRSLYWGCYLMAPWPGRVRNAVFEWSGRRHRLPRRDGENAIHGLVYDRPWTVERATPTTARLRCDLDGAGWPFAGSVVQEFALSEGGLVAAATIEAREAMPAALGWHPWFRATEPGARIRLAGDEVLETRELIPTGHRLAVDGPTDLRTGALVDDRALDHVYPDARPPATVTWPGLELRLDFDPPLATVVVHTRPGAFCVEPQTAWPNAIELAAAGVPGTGLAELDAGAALRAEMRWAWRPDRPREP
jgi:aldose 1-epimerase